MTILPMLSCASGMSFRYTVPLEGLNMRAISLNRVDFPAPDLPMIAVCNESQSREESGYIPEAGTNR
eukprot:937417-Prorocentrum_minimum.AAC.1